MLCALSTTAWYSEIPDCMCLLLTLSDHSLCFCQCTCNAVVYYYIQQLQNHKVILEVTDSEFLTSKSNMETQVRQKHP
jgi:hypothetical protein